MKKIDWLLSPLRKNLRGCATRRFDRDGRCRTLGRSEVAQQAELLEVRTLLSVSSVTWVEQGPGPIIGGQVLGMEDQGNPVAGAVQAIAIHPTDPNIMVVATARGGIWKATNALVGIDGIDNDNDTVTDEEEPTWTPKTDFAPTLAMMDIAYSPVDSNVLFAGTGSFSNSGTDAATAGVLKSMDGGETWTKLGKIGTDPFRIRAIVPTRQFQNGKQVLFAGAVQPNNRAAVDVSVGGLFRSRDGGENWSRISVPSGSTAGTGQLPAGAVADLKADPTDSSGLSLYAVVLGQGVYRTTDGGDSWQSMNGELGSNPLPQVLLKDFPEIPSTPTTPGTQGSFGAINARLAISNTPSGLQIAVGFANPPLPPPPAPIGGTPSAPIAQADGVATGVFVTTDQGANWTPLGVPSDELGNLNIGQQGNRNFVLAAHPTQSGLFYAAGDATDKNPSLGITNFVGHVMQTSTPGGWTTLVGNAASASAPHADARDMEFENNSGNQNLIQADDGGIYRLIDPTNAAGQRRWQSMNGNLRVMEVNTVAYDSMRDSFVIGNQDTGTAKKKTTDGFVWNQLEQGDGGTVEVGYTSSGSIRYYMGNNFQTFQRTEHATLDVFDLLAFPVDVELRDPAYTGDPEMAPLSGLTVADRTLDDFAIIPYAPNRFDGAKLLLARTGVAYLSTDKGDTVTLLNVPGFTERATSVVYGGRLDGVDAPDVIYIGTDGRKFDGTAGEGLYATFSSSVAPAETNYPGGSIANLVLDPDDARNAYVVDVSGRVWRGDAVGTASETWTNITGKISGSSTAPFAELKSVEIFNPGSGTNDEMLLVGGQGATEMIGSGVFFLQFPQFASGDAAVWAKYGSNLPNVTVTDIDYIPEDDLLVATAFGRGVWTVPSFADTVVEFARALGGPGHDDPVGIARTTDGGYVVAGTTTSISGNTADLFASKFDPRGNLVWSRTYAGSFFVPTPGGTAGPLTFDYATDIEPTSDGGVVVTGYTNGGGNSGLRVLIDSNGDVVGGSTQTFAMSGEDRLTSAADGGNLIGGNVALNFYREVRVGNNSYETVLGSKTFAVINGNLFGTKSEVDDFHSGQTTLRQLIKTSGGQTALVGTQGAGLNFKTIVYTDAAGIKGLGSDDETGVGIVETPADASGNRFYGVLSSPLVDGTGTGDPDVVVRKLDSSLNVIWERIFPGAAGAIEATADGGFVVASLAAFNRVQLVRLDASGELVWARQYDGRGVEGTTGFADDIDLVATPYGYIFTVPTTSFGDNDANTVTRDFWVVKTDAEGKVPIMTGLMTDITAGFPLTTFNSSTSSAEWFLLPGPQYDNFEDPPGPPPEEGDYDYIEYSNFYLPQNGTILSSVVVAPADGTPREQSTPFYNAGSFQFATSTAQTNEVTFDENGTPSHVVDVIVTRTDATHGAYGAARVNYSITFNGGATSSDFSINPLGGGSTFIDFADGETSKTAFRIFAQPDSDYDKDESITITLLDPDPLNGAVIGTRASTTITAINTNPLPGKVQFTSATYTVDENEPSITITVERTEQTETNMVVTYAIVGGTATGGEAGVSGRDYETDFQTSGTISFDNERTIHTFTIPIIDDPDVEGDETILLALSNPTNGGQLGINATATVTIRDIQPPPPLPIVPKFNGKIAFLGPVGEELDTDLFVMDPNGANLTNLSNASTLFENSPAWSPDGSKLAFAATGTNLFGLDASGLYVINANGTGLTQITTSFRDTDPVWSPDGTRIAYVHGDPFGGDQLVTIDPDGTDPDIVTTVLGVVVEPKWAPDGRHITYQGRLFSGSGNQLAATLVEIGVDGFGARVLFPSFSTTFDGSYTPDGTQMVFRGTLEGDDAIFRANVDGSGTPERLTDPVDSPFLSPDGTRLVYFVPGFEALVAVSNLDGSSANSLREGLFPGDPAWQPLRSNPTPDTQAPGVLSVTPSVASITDDDIGEANFSLTVNFNELMNTSVMPTLSFPVENPNATLTFNAAESGWTNSLTYVAKYNVVDAGKTLPNIDVRVTGGKDLAGNTHVATTSANEFGIAMAGTFLDMTPPVLTSIQRSNPLSQQTTATTLVFLVSFNEELDPASIDPSDFVVVGSTATVTSVVPDLNFGAIFSEVTVSGGNLATFVGSVGLSLNANSDIVDAVGNPVSLQPPETNETYLHGAGTPNRVPSFTKGANQTVLEDSGEKTVANWAKNISAGTGEAGQAVDFLVTNNNNAMFSSQPAISHNGTLTFTPAANAFGTATVTVRIHDDGGTAIGGVDTSAAQTFTITVTSVNDLPTSTSIAPQTINEDSSTGPISFTIGDVETPAANLTLKALSSTNTKLIPLSGITFGGSGANRTVTVMPVANQFGTSTIAFTIKDANGGVLTQNVSVTVNAINDGPPTITAIADVTIDEDKATGAIAFKVDDPDDKLVNLNAVTVTATSSNTDLVPNLPANIVLGGSAGSRTVKLVPLANQFGSTTITVTATDSSGATAEETFVLTVRPINDAPIVTASTLTIDEYTTNNTVVGTVAAVDPEGQAITSFAITGGNTGNAFKIDSATGVIRVNDATKIDFEALATYKLTIKATDALGLAGSKPSETGPVTINVNNQTFDFTLDLPEDTPNSLTISKLGNHLVVPGLTLNVPDFEPPMPVRLDDIGLVTINGGSEADTLILDKSLNSAGSVKSIVFKGTIVFNGGAGDDVLTSNTITVSTFGVRFDGGADNDSASAGAERDTLLGGDGNDLLTGGAGDDLLDGGAGDDALTGGKGNDTYRFADADTAEIDTVKELGNEGTDLLDFSALSTAVAINLNSETALATHANRTVKTAATGTTKFAPNFENGTGGAGADSILGNAANNSLLGGTGNDTIIGGAGKDTLRGGDDDDTLIGGLAADSLFGDAGTDLGLGGKGGSARGGISRKDNGDVIDASIETINEAFATVFAFEL